MAPSAYSLSFKISAEPKTHGINKEANYNSAACLWMSVIEFSITKDNTLE